MSDMCLGMKCTLALRLEHTLELHGEGCLREVFVLNAAEISEQVRIIHK